MDELKKAIAVADVLRRKYGANQERVNRLTKAYGKDEAEEIQKEVNYCIKNDLEDRYLAVACIADHYGKDPRRSKKIGKRWADKVQARINAIYSMRGKTIEQAARDVINDNYGKGKVRELLLTFCGYTPGEVQDRVNLILKPVAPAETPTRFRIHMIPFFKHDSSTKTKSTSSSSFKFSKYETISLLSLETDSESSSSVSAVFLLFLKRPVFFATISFLV